MTYEGATELITPPTNSVVKREKNSIDANEIKPQILYQDKQDAVQNDIPLEVVKSDRQDD